MRRTLLLLLALALCLAHVSPSVLASSEPEAAPTQEAGPTETPVPGPEVGPDAEPGPAPETDSAALLASGDDAGSGVSWAVYDTGELRISGNGAILRLSWKDWLETITSLVIEPGITAVGNGCFAQHPSLERVTVSDTVRSIGGEAFAMCPRLTRAVLPEGLTELGADVFRGCAALSYVYLPASLTALGQGASFFADCPLLTSAGPAGSGCAIEYGWTDAIPDRAFQGTNALLSFSAAEGTVSLGSRALSGCASLREVALPDSLTSLGSYAFGSCTALTEIDLPRDIAVLPEGLFTGCTALERAGLPARLETIGSYAFQNCRNLAEISFPAGVTEIGYGAFLGAGLSEIVFEGPPPQIDNAAFWRMTTAGQTAYYPAGEPAWTEEYRQDYGGNITWVTDALCGDVNNDGTTDRADHVCLALSLAGRDAGPIDDAAADLNGDGIVDRTDRVALARLLEEQNG